MNAEHIYENLNNYCARHILSAAVGFNLRHCCRLLYVNKKRFTPEVYDCLFKQCVILWNNVTRGTLLLDRIDQLCDVEVAEFIKQYRFGDYKQNYEK